MRLCLRPPWVIPERLEEIQIMEKTLQFLTANSIEKNDMIALKKFQDKFGLVDKFQDVMAI